MHKIFNFSITNSIIFLLLLWQLISVGLMATGVWQSDVALITTAILAVAIVLLRKTEALWLFLLSLPFMVVLPKLPLANFPMWRILLFWLFTVTASKVFYEQFKKQTVKDFIIKFWQQTLTKLDKWFFVLMIFAAMSIVLSVFPAHGAKQILFIINAYLIYLTVLLIIDSAEKFKLFKQVLLWSLLLTVGLGFVQYMLTFYASPYYFWQYWATMVSGLYYGHPLGEVLSYSNSWFAAGAGGHSSLRMFGIMQDTHSFGVLIIFALSLWIGLKAKIDNQVNTVKSFIKNQSREFWLVLVLLTFAIVASGTRGIWVAMLVPAFLAITMAYKWTRVRKLLILPILAYIFVVILFIVSPWISFGLNLIRTIDSDDNFLNRASSIYDLEESSNVGRLEIWQNSVKFAATHPFGTGYGNFITSIVTDIPDGASFEQIATQENDRYNLPQKFITAHNLYLQVLVELGLIGLVLFIIFWLLVAKRIYQKLLDSKFELTRSTLVMLNIGLALLWLLAYGLFDVTILNDRVLIYLMMLMFIINTYKVINRRKLIGE